MTIKIHEKKIDEKFIRKLEEISGENIHKCMQCGTCTAGCPVVEEMDDTPRRVMLFSHLGMKEEITDSNTVWLCASCNTCFSRCPRGINIPKVMEAIRLLSLRENKNHIEPNQISKEDLRELPQIALVSCFRKHTS